MLMSPQAFGGISGNINVVTFERNFCSCAEHPLLLVAWGEQGGFLPLLCHLLVPKIRQTLVSLLGLSTPMHRGSISCVTLALARDRSLNAFNPVDPGSLSPPCRWLGRAGYLLQRRVTQIPPVPILNMAGQGSTDLKSGDNSSSVRWVRTPWWSKQEGCQVTFPQGWCTPCLPPTRRSSSARILPLPDHAHFFPVPTLNSLCGSEELFVRLPTTKLTSLFFLRLPAAIALRGKEIWEATPAGLLGLLEEKHLLCQVIYTKI